MSSTTPVDGVQVPPTIDTTSSEDVCEQLKQACIEWGAFYYPCGNINSVPVFTQMQEYFNQPIEVKLQSAISQTLQSQIDSYVSGSPPRIGYGKPNVVKAGQPEAKETFSYVPGNGHAAYDDYCAHMSDIATHLLSKLRLASNIKESSSEEPETTTFRKSLSLVRYSPPLLSQSFWKSSLSVGLGSHTDWGYLTIIATDAPGLQIFHKKQWCDIPPREGHFLVHIGDVLAHQSSGVMHSPVHRVISPTVDVYKNSVVFFFEPYSDTMVDHSQTYREFISSNVKRNSNQVLTAIKNQYIKSGAPGILASMSKLSQESLERLTSSIMPFFLNEICLLETKKEFAAEHLCTSIQLQQHMVDDELRIKQAEKDIVYNDGIQYDSCMDEIEKFNADMRIPSLKRALTKAKQMQNETQCRMQQMNALAAVQEY